MVTSKTIFIVYCTVIFMCPTLDTLYLNWYSVPFFPLSLGEIVNDFDNVALGEIINDFDKVACNRFEPTVGKIFIFCN